MRKFTRVLLVSAAIAAPLGLLHAQSAVDILTAGCADDAQKLCAGVQSGGGRIIACLKQHKNSLSAKCKQAAAQVSTQAVGAAPNATPAAPSAVSKPSASDAADSLIAAPTAPKASAGAGTPAVKSARPTSTASATSSKTADAKGSYLLMKKVTVIGPGSDTGPATQPAFDLLVPSTWKFVGNVVMGGAKSGCFADMFALNIVATSADGATIFQTVPDYSWQYADDPSIVQNLNDPKRRALGADRKSCAVARPVKA